jgi:DNA anti-recombination protein RmuC
MTAVIVAMAVAAAGTIAALLRRRRPGRRSINIDPFTLGERWRHHVMAAQAAQRRYSGIVAATPSGPLKSKLESITRQVRRGVDECWLIAKRGNELDAALNRLDTPSLQAHFEQSNDEATRASLQAQLESAQRIRETRDDTDQRLRLLNTRLGELLAHAAEVSVGSDLTTDLGSAVDDVVTQLESLRLAVEDVNNTASGSTGQAFPSP